MRHKSRKQQKSHQTPIRIQYNGMSNVGHIQDIRLKAKICTENAPSAKYYYQMTSYLPWMNDEKKRKRNSAGGEREKLRRKSVSFYCFIGFVSFSCNGEIKWLSSFSLFAISLVLMRRNFWGNSENSMPVRNSCACDFHFVYHHRIIKMYSYDLVYVLSYFFFLMNVLCFVLFFSPLLSIFFLFILILFDFHVADNFVVLSQHSLPDLICTWLFSTSFWMKLFFWFLFILILVFIHCIWRSSFDCWLPFNLLLLFFSVHLNFTRTASISIRHTAAIYSFGVSSFAFRISFPNH